MASFGTVEAVTPAEVEFKTTEPSASYNTYGSAEAPAKEEKKKDPFKDANMDDLSVMMSELCTMSATLNSSGCTVSQGGDHDRARQQQQQREKEEKEKKARDPKNKCAKCGRFCGETYYDVEGKRYHPECFRCSRCRGPVTEYIVGEDGEIVCVDCDKKMNYVTCNGCHKDVLRTAAVNVFDGYYHPNCFKCAHCGKPIRNDFLEFNGKPYCTENDNECYKAVACQMCATCGKFITGAYMEIMGKFYHKDCFACAGCHKKFETAEFYAVDNKPYCEACAIEASKY